MNCELIKSVILKINYTDGKLAEYRVNNTCNCDDFDFEIPESEVFRPRLTAKSDVKLNYIELSFALDPDFANDKLLYYVNNSSTNDNVAVLSLKMQKNARTSDVTVMKNTETQKTFGFGRVTGKRFYSWIYIDNATVNIHYEMEDKPLVPGDTYLLEEYILGCEDTDEFLQRYAATVAYENNARPTEKTPIGFCSWSCWFSDVTEEKIIRTTDELVKHEGEFANLVQIDDGWQKSRPFCGRWECDTKRFPNGMAYTADYVHSKGLDFGLWAAPLLIDECSEYYNELKHMVREDEITLGDATHPFDLDNPAYYDFLRETFLKLKNEYHADYFKIDFILAAVKHFTAKATCEAVRFKSDYSVALLRRALQTIRDAVGDEVLLLSCGAPILECVGIFDLQRVSCDIIWGKSKSFPQYWDIVKNASSAVLHRWFYNRVVFTNDPDGIVVRDIDRGDGFNCTYSEAQYWSAVAMLSGGSQLHNEELDELSHGRRMLITEALPPIGATARPVDFFENNPTSVYAELPDGRIILALFNLGDSLADIEFDLSRIGVRSAEVTDYYTKEVFRADGKIKVETLNAHGVAMYILERKEPEHDKI